MTTTQRLSHWLADHRSAVDVVAVVLVGPLLVLTAQNTTMEPGRGPAAPWVVAALLPLAVRRRWPVASAVAVFAVSGVQAAVGPPLLVPANLMVLVSLYTVTVYGPRWAGRTAMVGIVAGAGVMSLRLVGEWGADYLVPQAVTFGSVIVVAGLAVWALGMLRRARVETMEALRDRAERLERERDQQALIAAAAERARIAREMHDVVAHSLSIVVAQADGGRYAAQADPAAAVPVLATIGDTGRAALADVRRILGVLRDGPESGTSGPPVADGARSGASAAAADVAPRAPQPTSGDVPSLLDGVRRAGLDVSMEDVGTPVELTAGLELTVHRVLQEALTNVLKHAGPRPTVSVVRRWTADRLVIEVADDGRGAASDHPAPGGGLGLVGMRERVALFDGQLDAGPRDDGGGFRVRAQLPLTPATTAATTSPRPAAGTGSGAAADATVMGTGGSRP